MPHNIMENDSAIKCDQIPLHLTFNLEPILRIPFFLLSRVLYEYQYAGYLQVYDPD